MKPAVGQEQVEPGILGARGRGDKVDFVGNPGRFRPAGQGIEGFRNHLRGEAGDGEQDTAWCGGLI